MEKGIEEDNSDVPDTTDDGQNNEEGAPVNNNTPVIDDPESDGQDQSEENPDGSDVTTPEENLDETEAEIPEEVPEDSTSTVDSSDAEVMAISDIPIEFTITVDGTAVDDSLTNYVAELSNVTEGKVDDTNDVTFKVAPTNEELMLADATSVKATIDDGNATALTDKDGVYTITDSHSAATGVAVTIAFVTKTYTVTAPDTANNVTWKIKESTVSGAATETSVDVKKGASVTVTATLADDADPVDVTVKGETKSLTASSKSADFTVALADLTEQSGSYPVSATYVVKKVDANVLIKGKKGEDGATDAVFGTDFTAQYRVKTTGATEFTAWADVSNGTIAAKKDDTVQLKFTPGAKFSVSGVTFGTDNTDVTADEDEDGEDIYQITVAAPAATPAAENTVTVTLAAANQIKLKAAADAQIASVKWNTDNGSTWKSARKVAGDWVVDTKAATVYFQVAAKPNNKVSYINNDTKGAHAATGTCDNCLVLTTSNNNKTVTTADVNASGADDVTLTIATEHIKLDYTLTADAGLTVAIKDASGAPVPAKGTTDELKNKYTLLDGETYSVEVKQGENVVALEKLQTATANGTKMDYDADKDAFTFEAKESVVEASRTIVIALKARQNKTVSVKMADAQPSAASVKADAHKKLGDDGKTEEDVVADDTATPLTTDAKDYTVAEGGAFSFALSMADDAYVVSKVETSTDNGTTWTPLEKGSDGKYAFTAVDTDTQVRVTTDLDQTKAHSITFTADENVKAIKLDLAGGTSYTTEVKAGEKYYLKAAANAAVTFTVDAYDGFTVDKVASGTADADKITPEGTKYTYTFEEATKTDAAITVSTKSIALTENRYVAFDLTGAAADVADGTLELNVTTANVKTEKNAAGKDVYVLTQEVTEGENVTPEVPELAFDLVVKDGYTLQPQLASIVDSTNNTVRMTADSRKKGEDGRWVYSFKVVAAALQSANAGATKDTPKTIAVTAVNEEKVTLSLKAGSESVQYKNLSDRNPSFGTWSSSPKSVSDKDTIVLQVAEGQSLSVGGKDVTKDLDEIGNYSFVAALDPTKDNETNIEIEVKASDAAYELLYGDTEGTYPNKVGKDAVEAKLGDKIYVQLNKIALPNNTAETITDVKLSEGAKKSTAVKDADQTANTGKAVITVGDADFTVTFKAIKEETVNGFTKKTVVDAASIHITAKDADGMKLTAKGISAGKTIKIDATKQMSYSLTLKSGDNKTTLDVKEYLNKDALVVESSKDAVVAGFNKTTGELVLRAKKDKDGENKAVSEITIKAKGAAAEASPLLTFKVEVQTPKLVVKSVNSINQGMHDLLIDVTGDPKIGTVATADFDMYYEIEVKHKEGSSASKKDGIYYLNALDGNGNVVPVSQLIKVNGDTDDKCENTYTVTTRLVAVDDGATVTTGTPAEGATGTKLGVAAVKFASDKTVEKEFKTRPGNYEEKLGVTKKTTKLYSGQRDVLVAIPKFSAKAGHIEKIDAQVYNTDGSLASGVTANVDPSGDTMNVYVTAGNNSAPGKGAAKYNVVIYATATMNAENADKDPGEYNMYRASAKVPITVQKGIHKITVDGNPGKIAVVPDNKGNKKDVSFTLKPTGWYYYDVGPGYSYTTKAQTQKFDYNGTITYTNPKNAGMVTVKNGKVTVSKDFYVSNDPAQNTFSLSVKANDWTGNTTASNLITVEVTNKAMEISSVRLVRSNGTPYGATISTDELYGATVEVLDGNGKEVDPSYVTLTPNKGKLYADKDGDIYQYGYQKNLTITAVAKDGKKAKKSSIKYTIEYPKVNHYGLESVSINQNNSSLKQMSDTSWEYTGRGNEYIDFEVTAFYDSEEQQYSQAYTYWYNYSVKVVGGKIVSGKDDAEDGDYRIMPTADKVTVTVTDKNKPTKAYTFTITDKNWQKDAAPKASTKDKLFLAKEATTGSVIAQDMTYTIKNCKYTAVKFTQVGGSYSGISGLAGVHDIDGDTLVLTGLVPTAATTEKYAVVYGDKDEKGKFWPKTKAANISIKVSKVGNIKAVNKYTISTNLGYGVKLDAKPIPTSVTLGDVVQFNSIEAANVKGQPNKFYEYFELNDAKDAIQIKTKYQNEQGLAAIEALPKTDLNGYLTYTVYNPNGNKVTKQDKITVAVNDTGKPKATATAINIVGKNAASAFTNVKVGNTAVDVLKVVTDSADWNVAAATADELATGNGNVKLTAKAAPVAGNVNLYILPVESKYPATAADDVIKEKGIKATVKVTVKDEGDTKFSKIKFLSKNAKTPDASIVGQNVNLSTTFTLGSDYDYTLSNASITSVEKVPEAREAEISGAASKTAAKAIVATNGVTINAEKTAITIVMDRDAEGLDQKGKTTYKVPVLVKFDAGAEEIVYFPIKPAAVPSVESVAAEVEKALKDLPVDNYNNGTAAAAEVQTAARALSTQVVPELSGVKVTNITAAAKPDTETDTFADTGTPDTEGFKAGHHTVIVTLDDETKKGTEGYTATTVNVVVTKMTAAVGLGKSLTEAINVYLLPDTTTGAVPTGKTEVPTTMTKWTLQTELQAAADKAEAGKYIVRVTAFDIHTTEVTVPAASGTSAVNADEGTKKTIVDRLIFTYTVMDAKTGEYMGDESGYEVTMGTVSNTVQAPEDTEEPPVTPPETTSYDVTISGGENCTVTSAIAEANDDSVPSNFDAITNGKVSVKSDKKLYLKVVPTDGYTVTVTAGNTPVNAVEGNANVYLIGAITEAVEVTIEATQTSQPGEDGDA